MGNNERCKKGIGLKNLSDILTKEIHGIYGTENITK